MPVASRVTAIEPGPMDTPFFYGQETLSGWLLSQIPGDGQPTHPDLKILFDCEIFGNRGALMDYRADDFRQCVATNTLNLGKFLALQRSSRGSSQEQE